MAADRGLRVDTAAESIVFTPDSLGSGRGIVHRDRVLPPTRGRFDGGGNTAVDAATALLGNLPVHMEVGKYLDALRMLDRAMGGMLINPAARHHSEFMTYAYKVFGGGLEHYTIAGRDFLIALNNDYATNIHAEKIPTPKTLKHPEKKVAEAVGREIALKLFSIRKEILNKLILAEKAEAAKKAAETGTEIKIEPDESWQKNLDANQSVQDLLKEGEAIKIPSERVGQRLRKIASGKGADQSAQDSLTPATLLERTQQCLGEILRPEAAAGKKIELCNLIRSFDRGVVALLQSPKGHVYFQHIKAFGITLDTAKGSDFITKVLGSSKRMLESRGRKEGVVLYHPVPEEVYEHPQDIISEIMESKNLAKRMIFERGKILLHLVGEDKGWEANCKANEWLYAKIKTKDARESFAM